MPFLGEGSPGGMVRLFYSVVFFVIACVVAQKPDRLTERLGKVLTPCLLTLIAVVFVGCVVNPASGYGQPVQAYARNPLVRGFLEGYLTMDKMCIRDR